MLDENDLKKLLWSVVDNESVSVIVPAEDLTLGGAEGGLSVDWEEPR